MPVLTIRHHEAAGAQLVTLGWSDDRLTVPFDPRLDRFDLEDLRWYHENYRQNWGAASESAVARIRGVQRKVGEALHGALFAGDALPMAAEVRRAGPELRVEVQDDAHDAAIPWELMTDPETGEPLALQASSFVRTVGEVVAGPMSEAACRVLLLISRPHGMDDIGYWAVAYELWRTLSTTPWVKVDVLRPPTFEALHDRLHEAMDEGVPYTAVHFDGHGAILNPFGGARHTGYLVFEKAERDGPDFVDGSTLGRLLVSAGVLLCSMNACRSADSAGDRHLRARPEEPAGQPSIIEEVLAAGVPACVGMGREVYPGTPSRFFATFYGAFVGGHSAGEAAHLARVRLREEPLTAGTFREESAPVDDWSIPVVGERMIVRLPARPSASRPDPTEPTPPVVGFDRAVLLMEAALAESPVVLVCGPLLSGKSRLAVEYGRWLSGTSPTSCPVRYVALGDTDDPAEIAKRLPSDLQGRGGLLILDQADRVGPSTQSFLADALARLNGACQVVVTARSPSQPWLPPHELVTPDILPRALRAELGSLWARAAGVEFDARKYHSLVFFCGGFPGVLLLLLGISHELVERGEATAKQIAWWLHECAWTDIARLGSAPVSLESLVDQVVADLSARFDSDELLAIRYTARLNVACDDAVVARLLTAVTGTDLSDEVAAELMRRLLATGLVQETGVLRPSWFLHPLLKLVASRLPLDRDLDLDDAMIGTVAEVCAELSADFRRDTTGVVEMFGLHLQNMLDAVWLALERDRLDWAAKLAEGICLYCRYEGDIERSSRVLDTLLPYFINPSTGELRPECRETGIRVWEQAIWIGLDWPRHGNPLRTATVRLRPPENDHYAAGLFYRAVDRPDLASKAFLAELRAPADSPRYSSGEIEWHLSEIKFTATHAEDLPIALEGARRSHAARRADDTIGRASSRILQARIRLAMWSSHQQDDHIALDEVADLLREAQSEPGGWSAENRSAAAMVWSAVMLERGDLTSAVSFFEEGTAIMAVLQSTSIWRHYMWFARRLIRHGWVTRGYEVASAAFHYAMRAGDHANATEIRKLCEHLKSTHPELTP